MTDSYSLWYGNAEPLPPRSRLASLKPIAHKTMWQESISGLIVRIARAHTCSPTQLICDQILRHTVVKQERTTSGTVSFSLRTMNGVSKYANVIHRHLEELTLQPELKKSTFLAWGDILDPRGCGLLHLHPHWCKECFVDWHKNCTQAYFPLMWMALPVKSCPNHGTPLVDVCPHCHRNQPFVPKHTYPDHCSWCGQWLGGNSGTDAISLMRGTADERKRNKYQQQAILEMIATLEEMPILSFINFQKRLREIIDGHFGGNISHFKRSIGFRDHRIRVWINEDIRPTLPLFLLLTQRLGTSPIQFLKNGLNSDFQPSDGTFAVPVIYEKRKMSDTERGQIKTDLEAIISTGISDIPMREVAERLGHRVTFLQYWFPSECRSISDLFRLHKNIKAKQKKDSAVDVAKSIVRELFEQRVKVTRKAIQKRLYPHRIFLSQPEIRDAVNEQKRALLLPLVETNRKKI